MEYTYEQLQNMRKLLVEEIQEQVTGTLSVDHLLLVEQRLQSMIMAGLDDGSIDSVKADFPINISKKDLNG